MSKVARAVVPPRSELGKPQKLFSATFSAFEAMRRHFIEKKLSS